MIREVTFELCVETIYVVEVNVNTRTRLLYQRCKEVMVERYVNETSFIVEITTFIEH